MTSPIDNLFEWAIEHKYLDPKKVNKEDLKQKTLKFICYQKHEKKLAQKLFPRSQNPALVATIIRLWFLDIYESIHNGLTTPQDYDDIDLVIDDFWQLLE